MTKIRKIPESPANVAQSGQPQDRQPVTAASPYDYIQSQRTLYGGT